MSVTTAPALGQKTPNLSIPGGACQQHAMLFPCESGGGEQYEAVCQVCVGDLATGALTNFSDKLLLSDPQDRRPSRALGLGRALGRGGKASLHLVLSN